MTAAYLVYDVFTETRFGGNQLNNEISRRYGMTSEEAENAKRK